MSFDGFYQKICVNGHYSAIDVYSEHGDWKCSVCQNEEIWSNIVNTTNGSYDINPDTGKEERIDGYVELEIDVPAKQCTCSCCGNTHQVAPATYKIPKEK